MNINHSLLFSILTISLISGCAMKSHEEQVLERDSDLILTEKVTQASDAVRDYVTIINENRALTSSRQANIFNDELRLDFIGKPQELLKALAIRYGYKYSEVGMWVDIKPINIFKERVTPLELLRNIGYQIDAQANVILDIDNKTIRLQYKPNISK